MRGCGPTSCIQADAEDGDAKIKSGEMEGLSDTEGQWHRPSNPQRPGADPEVLCARIWMSTGIVFVAQATCTPKSSLRALPGRN